MSESKARMQREITRLERDLSRVYGHLTFLLQSLTDLSKNHPGVEIPDLGDRFSEMDWMRVTD